MTVAGPVPRTAVVVVNHDTREDLLGCLDTLTAAGADEVVVVDCGSADGSVEAVHEAHPGVTVLALPNVGYGRGANAGVARSRARTVVVANADTRFAPDSVRALDAALEADGTLGAVGPAVRYPDGRRQASARSTPTLSDAFGHALFGLWRPDNRWTRRYRMLDADPEVPRDVDWLSGCAIAVRREAFRAVDGFDPGFFMYVEDVDLGRRLRDGGWRLRYVPAASVVHAVGASTAAAPLRNLVGHARSLDRYYGLTTGSHPLGRVARPLVRLALTGWVALAAVWRGVVGRRGSRSSTGE